MKRKKKPSIKIYKNRTNLNVKQIENRKQS
jgi:hypothetical protein